MFPPDADTDPSDAPSFQQPVASTSALPLGDPKGIRYHATRLMEVENGGRDGSVGGTPSPSRSRINAAISGTPCTPLVSLYSLSLRLHRANPVCARSRSRTNLPHSTSKRFLFRLCDPLPSSFPTPSSSTPRTHDLGIDRSYSRNSPKFVSRFRWFSRSVPNRRHFETRRVGVQNG